MDLNKPVNKRWSYCFIDPSLSEHVGWVGIPFLLDTQHVLMNILAKLRNVINVTKCSSVNLLNLAKYLVFAPLIELQQFLMNSSYTG